MSVKLPKTTLVLGGARSGKSRRALDIAESSGLAPVLIATATAGDAEMADRIARHRAERDARWQTVEEPLRLADALRGSCAPDRIVVVDCLTFWLANLFFQEQPIEPATEALATGIAQLSGPCILVSNEVGWSIVPENDLARRFRDAQGRLNQKISAACTRVELVVAGIPLFVKG